MSCFTLSTLTLYLFGSQPTDMYAVDNIVAIIDANSLPTPPLVHNDNEFTPQTHHRQLDASDSSTALNDNKLRNIDDNPPSASFSSAAAETRVQVRQRRVYQPTRLRIRGGRRLRTTARTSSGSAMKTPNHFCSSEQDDPTSCTQGISISDSVDVDMMASSLYACSLQCDLS